MQQRDPAIGGPVASVHAGAGCFSGRVTRQGWGAQPPEKPLAELGSILEFRTDTRTIANEARRMEIRTT